MALVNGLYKLTDQEFHDRPVYQNVGNGHSFLSWYYDATQMTEGDGYWKISAENMLDKMNTRNHEKYKVPFSNTSRMQNSRIIHMIKLLNEESRNTERNDA